MHIKRMCHQKDPLFQADCHQRTPFFAISTHFCNFGHPITPIFSVFHPTTQYFICLASHIMFSGKKQAPCFSICHWKTAFFLSVTGRPPCSCVTCHWKTLWSGVLDGTRLVRHFDIWVPMPPTPLDQWRIWGPWSGGAKGFVSRWTPVAAPAS